MDQFLMVAGGVVAVYVVLALIVSQIVEWINTWLNVRGKLLYDAIARMISAGNDSEAPAGKVLAAIYSHPFVGNLGMKDKPSYVSPRTFTISLLAALRALESQPGRTAPPVPAMDADGDALLKDLRDRVAAVFPDNDPLGKNLKLLIEQTENKYDSVLKAVDTWFQAQMDRVTGTFKRHAVYMQMALAGLVVYALHADSFALVNSLSRSAAAQSAIGVAQDLHQTNDIVRALTTLADYGIVSSNIKLTPWVPSSAQELFGVVATWLAVLLGAPFWFDVLKQIVPVRLSGAKPDAEAAAKGDKQAVSPSVSS